MLVNKRYQLQEPLGSGGMGTVFRAQDAFSRQVVAVKRLKKDTTGDPLSVERFNREAEALRQLDHPNIVKVLDSFIEDHQHYIVMEYLPGSLSDLMAKDGRLSIAKTLDIALDLADALTRVHRLRIIHRDLKPANVLLAADGSPRLTDFGVAHIERLRPVTDPGMTVGTVDYLSPEAINGLEVDARTDIWSFGVLLFEMLTGTRPFAGGTITQTVTAIITHPTPDLEILRPDAPIGLIDLIYRMLDKDREARIPSVRQVGTEIEALMHGIAAPPSTPRRGARQRSADNTTRRFNTPTPTDGRPHHNLPTQPTAFVGREAELQELDRLLRDPNNRLITILGPGGMGKTRLSLEAASHQLDNFRGGVYFVALAPLNAVDHVPAAIADALNYTFVTDERTQIQQLQDYLSEKHTLLVIDNFEHLLGAATIVSDLLHTTQDLKIIATSREKLNLYGEIVFNLDGLSFPKGKAQTTIAQALEYSAVRLFVQSARRAQPGIDFTDADLPHIVTIVQMVGGMPLGIELAAAWIEALTLAEIAQEITASLDFLQTEVRDVPERHRSLRAVFDSSWKLLNPDEQQSFKMLCVFRGGFTRQAAQAVTGASLRSLTTLVNKSLLRRDPSGRYFVHELLRQYAEEQFHACTNTEQNTNQRAHAEYFARYVADLTPVFNTRDANRAADDIELELENIRTAWHWLITAQAWEILDSMQHGMLLYFEARSLIRESKDFFTLAVEAMERAGVTDTLPYWRARMRQVWLAGRAGEYALVRQVTEPALAYFRTQNNITEICYALNGLSYAKMMQGDVQAAIDDAAAAERLSREIGAMEIVIFSLANMSYAYYLQGSLKEAQRLYEQIENSYNTVDAPAAAKALGMNNFGEILRELNQFEEAQSRFQQAYDLFKAARQRRGMAYALNNLGGICFVRGRYEDAEVMYEEAYGLFKDIGDRYGLSHAISALGNVAFYKRDYDRAAQLYGQSLDIRRALGNRRGIADSLDDLAFSAMVRGQWDDARRCFEEALALHREIGDVSGIVHGLTWRGITYGMDKDYEQALANLQEAFALSEKVDNALTRFEVYLGLAEVYFQHGDYADSETYYFNALRDSHRLGIISIELFALIGMAGLIAARGDQERALEIAAAIKAHPPTFINYMTEEKTEKLIQKISKELPAETVQAALERGSKQDIDFIISSLILSQKAAQV